MATDFNTEANYFELKGLVLAANEATDHTAAADGEHAADAGAGQEEMIGHTEVHDGATGMPQLDMAIYPNLIFWFVLTFVAAYFILARIAIPRIGGTLENRVQTIQRDLDRAAAMKLKAEEAEQTYKQALVDARAKAHEISEKTKAEIQADLDAATAKADAEIAKQAAASSKRIAQMQTEAEASVKDIATEVAKALIDAVAPGAGDEKALSKAVEKVLKG